VCNAPLVGLFKLDCGLWRATINATSASSGNAVIVMIKGSLYDYLADSVSHWNCFSEFAFGSLHSGVSIGNRIGAEGVKALGDALKDNSTLASLSLTLRSA
jgi:hypothetical protein